VPVTVISYVPVVVVEVVVAVSVAVWAVVPLRVTEAGDRAHVTGLVALEGEVVTAQLRATVPLDEFVGVTVIVDVLPEVAPGLLTPMAPLLERVKLAPAGSQKPLHPASSSGAASTSFHQLVVVMSRPLEQGTAAGYESNARLWERRRGSAFRLSRPGAATLKRLMERRRQWKRRRCSVCRDRDV
jgi:hypothetical protein